MSRLAYIAGVGMVPFRKPGESDSYQVMGARAAVQALADAGVAYADVQQAFAGYVYGDSTCGQAALYEVGTSGIPIINVNNNCATGSTALFLARQWVTSGAADCVLALGFEQMQAGSLKSAWGDRPSPGVHLLDRQAQLHGHTELPNAIRLFGSAGLAHMQKFGTRLETFAKIRAKASRHAARNPLAVFRKVVTEEEVMAAPMLWDGVMSRLMACPPTCGAAAAVVVSERFARRRGLRTDVAITGQALTTDAVPFEAATDMIRLVGFEMSKSAAQQAFSAAGVGPADVDVVELHDCFAQNELISYEALGLCAEGEGEKMALDGDNTYGGRYVVNPSGGLLSKGHPLGATGLAQCFELTSQLRGEAGDRQVKNARIALQHNIGLGGACVVTVYQSMSG